MDIQKFGEEGFARYYQDAYIRHPETKTLICLTGGLNRDNRSLEYREGGNRGYIKLAELSWECLAFPTLGYVNLAPRGQCVYWVVRRVERITSKGFSHRTIKVVPLAEMITSMYALGLNPQKYQVEAVCSKDVAKATFDPQYVTLPKAIGELQSKADTVGFALNQSVAVVLGPNQKDSYKLLWKQHEAAVSEDGEVWTALSQDFKDVLNRSLGKLNYAN